MKYLKIHQGEGAFSEASRLEGDALYTVEPDLPIAAYAADCLLIIFASTETRLVAIAHAGWRGTLGRISEKLVCHLKQTYKVNPANLVAAFSPSI